MSHNPLRRFSPLNLFSLSNGPLQPSSRPLGITNRERVPLWLELAILLLTCKNLLVLYTHSVRWARTIVAELTQLFLSTVTTDWCVSWT